MTRGMRKEHRMTNKIFWDDILIITFAISIMIVWRGILGESVYQIIPILLFFLVSGIKGNIKGLLLYISCHRLFLLICIICMVYFSIYKHDLISCCLFLNLFATTYVGNTVITCGYTNRFYQKFWTLLLAVFLLDLFVSFNQYKLCFMNIQLELYFLMFFLSITFFYTRCKWRRFVGGGLAVIFVVVLFLKYPAELQSFSIDKEIIKGSLTSGIPYIISLIIFFAYLVFELIKKMGALISKRIIVIICFLFLGALCLLKHWTTIAFVLPICASMLPGLMECDIYEEADTVE